MFTSRRAAGLGLLAYGIGTPLAFMSIGSPGGAFRDADVAAYVSGAHAAPAFALAYVGLFAALGLLVFGARMRDELGGTVWGQSVAAAAAAVTGWFLVGGIAVAAAEGGDPIATVPHPTLYVIGEMSNLVAVCAPAFLVGIAALVLAARGHLAVGLRVVTGIAGVCGLLAAFYLPIFLFWLWTIGFGVWLAVSRTREPARAAVPAA